MLQHRLQIYALAACIDAPLRPFRPRITHWTSHRPWWLKTRMSGPLRSRASASKTAARARTDNYNIPKEKETVPELSTALATPRAACESRCVAVTGGLAIAASNLSFPVAAGHRFAAPPSRKPHQPRLADVRGARDVARFRLRTGPCKKRARHPPWLCAAAVTRRMALENACAADIS